MKKLLTTDRLFLAVNDLIKPSARKEALHIMTLANQEE